MPKDQQRTLNQILLILLTPPLYFVAIDFLATFFAISDPSGYSSIELSNSIRPPLGLVLVYLFPYPIAFYFRSNQDFLIPAKLAVCVASAANLLEPIFSSYDPRYWITLAFLSGSGLFGLLCKVPERKNLNLGKYPLALDPRGRLFLPTTSLHENVQIVGGTGTGKTYYVIKPFIHQTILQGLGCFVLDVKGNLGRDLAFYTSQAGNRRLLHLNLEDLFFSHSYNPLFGDNPDAIANRVFTALYYDTRNTERYYVELADAFLKNLIGLLKKEIKTITFQDLLTATQEAENFRTITWFCAKYQQAPQAAYFREQWLGKSPKDRRMELSGLINKLQRFCNSEWAPYLNVRNPEIKMSEVVSKGEVFLFSPASARYPEDAKALSILAMMDLSERVADRYSIRPERPFRVFLDEFYNLAYPRFIDLINKCREAQVNLFLAHQSLGDLKGVSSEFLEQVMNTASNKIILRLNDPETAEAFARQFGTEHDLEYKVESFGADGAMAGFSRPPVEKFRFHPNLIKGLRVGQAIVKVVGPTGVEIALANLKPSQPIPPDFQPKGTSYMKRPRLTRNETSVPDLTKEVGKNPPHHPLNSPNPLETRHAL